MRHAVILAGGSGTRLWPLSRRLRPKQLLRLFDGASLLQLARRRLAPLFEPAQIFVITSAEYLDLVAAELPDVPRENLIGEPVGRDTANAIGLAAHLLARRDSAGTMAVFTADHLIGPDDAFAAAIRAGLDAAESHADSLVTFGVKPTNAHTGYGYLERGDPAPSLAAGGSEARAIVFHVKQFCEKPSQDAAERYLSDGRHLWNSGMFAWRIKTILDAIHVNLPQNFDVLAELARDWNDPLTAGRRAERFASLPKISIDHGVMEKWPRVLMVELGCQWLDVGSFAAIASTRPADAAGNSAIGAAIVALDARNNIAVSESGHLIALLGVEDLVVVHSPDATLICRRDQAERIREIAARAPR